MLWLGIFPSTLIMMWAFTRLHNLRKHDVILYRFCQIRRDMMQLLRDRGEDLPPEDYKALRFFLRTLNNLIQRYSEDRFHMLNMRALALWARNNAELIKKITIPESDDPQIKQLKRRVNVAISYAFFEYTPFLRSEITFVLLNRIALLISTLLIKLGSQAIRAWAERVICVFHDIQLIRENGVAPLQAALIK